MSADTAEKKPAARRGPRKEADIRAEVEAEMRERLEAEIRAEIEQQQAEKAKYSAEATPVSGLDITADPKADGALTVHFVDDGLTLLGKIWYRGEELTIAPGTDQWELAHSVLSLDEFQQEDRWGRRMFRPGPWRGKSLTEIDDDSLTEDDKVKLAKAEKIRRERFGN